MDDIGNIAAPGSGQLGLSGLQMPCIDLGAEGMPAEGVDVVLYPKGKVAEPIASIGCPKGSMIVLLPPEYAAKIRLQVKPHAAVGNHAGGPPAGAGRVIPIR